jgi:FkbM family methyltransferase
MAAGAPTDPGTTAERVGSRALRGLSGRGPRLHALATRLVDRAPTSVFPREGARRASWHGVDLDIDLRDNLQRTLYLTGSYEPTLLDGFTSAIAAGDTVVDVGANIGLYTIAAARRIYDLGTGRVVAVEPGTAAGDRLRTHLDRSGLADVVTIAPVAFGAEAATAELRANTNFDGGDLGTASLLGDGELLGSCEVVVGADWLADHGIERIDVLKIDVEGAESTVLDGLEPVLQAHPPRLVQVEVLDPEPGAERTRIFGVLEAIGLRGQWSSARGERPAAVGDRESGNVVFTRR